MGAFLVGQQGIGWTPISQNGFQAPMGAKYYKSGYIAQASGPMGLAHLNVPGAAGGLAWIYVYTGAAPAPGATLVAVSSPIDISHTGDRTAPISGNIVAGQNYFLIVQSNIGGNFGTTVNNGSNNFVDNQNNAVTMPIGNPPAVLPAADFGSIAQEFLVWIEGVTAFSPTQLPPKRRRTHFWEVFFPRYR